MSRVSGSQKIAVMCHEITFRLSIRALVSLNGCVNCAIYTFVFFLVHVPNPGGRGGHITRRTVVAVVVIAVLFGYCIYRCFPESFVTYNCLPIEEAHFKMTITYRYCLIVSLPTGTGGWYYPSYGFCYWTPLLAVAWLSGVIGVVEIWLTDWCDHPFCQAQGVMYEGMSFIGGCLHCFVRPQRRSIVISYREGGAWHGHIPGDPLHQMEGFMDIFLHNSCLASYIFSQRLLPGRYFKKVSVDCKVYR